MVKHFVQGFTTAAQEIQVDALPVTGSLPGWLDGTLIRNGPAQFEVNGHSYRHWFDGQAMLHSFTFANGRVGYASRFLRSNQYLKDNATGKINYGGFAVDPCRSLFSRVMSMFFPTEAGNNTNVNIAYLAGQYIAMTETPIALEFDPDTLATLGIVNYKDALHGQFTTAHPHYDFAMQAGLNYLTHVGASNAYNVYSVDASGRKLIVSIPVKQPAYMHSFGMSEHYIILCEFSLRLPNALSLGLGLKPFIENFVFQPEQDTIFTVIDKHSGEVVARVPTDAFFAFHHINAFEQGDTLIVDLAGYDDDALIHQLYLDALREGDSVPNIGQFRRYTVPLKGGRAAFATIPGATLDLPRINYRRCNGRDYQFVYGASVNPNDFDFLNQLIKIDVKTGQLLIWYEAGCYPGEPVFITAPDETAEDDGLILSVVLDSRTGTSFLLVLDAANFSEIARAAVPQHVPFGFHGQFFKP